MTSKLLKITQRLMSDAPNIILKENQLIRESLMREMRANIKKKDELLRSLTLLGLLENDIRTIDRQFNLLVENLNLLNTLSSQRIDITKDNKQMVARLRELAEIEETLSKGSHLAVTEKGYYSDAKNLLHQQIMILLSLQFEEDKKTIRDMEIRFVSLMQAVNDTFHHLSISEKDVL